MISPCYITVTCLFSGIFRQRCYYVGGGVAAIFRGPGFFYPLLVLKMRKMLADFGLLHLLQQPVKLAETLIAIAFQQCNSPPVFILTVTICYTSVTKNHVTAM